MGGVGKGMVPGGEGDAAWVWRGGAIMLGDGDVGVSVRRDGGGGGGGKSCVAGWYGWEVADARRA